MHTKANQQAMKYQEQEQQHQKQSVFIISQKLISNPHIYLFILCNQMYINICSKYETISCETVAIHSLH